MKMNMEGGFSQQPSPEQRNQKVLAELQARVALLARKESHPDEIIDVEHPENNSPELRGAAMTDWVADGSAESFGKLVDENLLDPDQQQELSQVLQTIRQREKGDTIH